MLRRRELIAGGLGALGAIVSLPETSAADLLAPAHGDREVLFQLCEIEQAIALGYERVLSAHVLATAAEPVAAGFLPHEREHVHVLSAALARLGVTPPSEAGAARSLAALGLLSTPRSSPDALHYLIALETVAEKIYYRSFVELSAPGAARLAAEIMACEAQHWTALSGLLHSGDVYSGVPQSTVIGR